MKSSNILIFIVLALLLQTCTGIYRVVSYRFYFENQSDYNIDIRSIDIDYDGLGNKREYKHLLLPSTIRPKIIYQTGNSSSYSYKDRKKAKAMKSDLFCLLNPQRSDSIRLYFDKGESHERYVTYSKREFKPRHLLNPEEYRYEETSKRGANFYYTFTNKDYHNANKHQNAMSSPIPTCGNIESACGPKICLWY